MAEFEYCYMFIGETFILSYNTIFEKVISYFYFLR